MSRSRITRLTLVLLAVLAVGAIATLCAAPTGAATSRPLLRPGPPDDRRRDLGGRAGRVTCH